jgi:hypothetical protein
MVRRYVIVHGLRLRVKSFWGDVVVSILLCIVLLLLWRAHEQVARIDPWKNADRIAKSR